MNLTRPWRDEALCAGEATRGDDPWFPLFDHDPRPGHRGHTKSAPAVQVCQRCPVRADCLTEALSVEAAQPGHERWGIFGGLTPRQRAGLDRRVRKATTPYRVRKKSA